MKVLHISNVLNNSGWSKAAEYHILALDQAGVDIYPVHISMINSENPDVSPRVLELLKKKCRHPDIIVQNVLPSFYEKVNTKCVGYSLFETDRFTETNWTKYCNMMDSMFVPCISNKEACVRSNVKCPTYVVPLCIDVNICRKEYSVHSIRQNHPDKFIFLTVGEWTKRKNIEAIIVAFHLEFGLLEPVELVIKTTPFGMNNFQEEINNRVNSIKDGLRLYNDVLKYKRENIICGFLSESDMYSIYQSVDCVVSASRAEAFCYPVMTAMVMGKSVVCPDHSGFDYIRENNAFVVQSKEDSCIGANDGLPNLYTGCENWWNVNILSLRKCMRDVYEKRNIALKKKQQAQKDVQKFSLENVGKIYREALDRIS